MSDSRPRPQYGEYATPEEQRAHIRVPLDHDEGVPMAPSEQKPPAEGVMQASTPPPGYGDVPSSSPAATTVPRTGDRLATYLLLGVGLASILLSLTSMVQMPTALDSVFRQFGIGGYTSVGIATAMGWTALSAHVVLWIAAFWLSRRSLAAGRVTWWIPLVAGVIANLIFIVCLGIAMASDPAFIEYVNGSMPQ